MVKRRSGSRRRRRSGRAAYGDKRPFVDKHSLGKLGGKVSPRSTRSSFVYVTKGGTVIEAKASKGRRGRMTAKPKWARSKARKSTKHYVTAPKRRGKFRDRLGRWHHANGRMMKTKKGSARRRRR